MQTVRTTPLELKIGDKVFTHGAVVEVMHITRTGPEVPDEQQVAACTSRLVGHETGSIPSSWFESRRAMVDRGCEWAHGLPEGQYWNVQGNAHASVLKLAA